MSELAPHILVIGGANRDITARANQEMIPLAESHIGQVSQTAGGVGRNIAETLARLGQKVTLLSAFGDDEFAHQMMAHLTGLDIDISPSIRADGQDSDCYLTIHDKDGEQVTAINQMALSDRITPSVITEQAEMIASADFVICDCNLSEASLSEIANIKRKGQLVLDGVSSAKIGRALDILSEVDILKCSRAEALSLVGGDECAPDEAVVAMMADKGAAHILLSQGASGFCIYRDDEAHQFEAIQTAPETISGAGDCLLAGYIYGLATGRSVKEAGMIARQCAYLSCQSVSAVSDHISLETIKNEI